MKKNIHFLLLPLLLAITLFDGRAQQPNNWVKIHAYAPEVKPSTDYTARINGKEAFVYQNHVGSILTFEMEGTATLELTFSGGVKYAVARPLSANITPTWQEKTIKITLDKPQQLSLEINGLTKTPLFIFAHPRLTTPKPSANVRVFEAGKLHRPGLVQLQSGQQVYIEGGAVVQGLFLAEKANNISIAGPGIIDASIGDSLKFPEGYRTRVISLLDCQQVTLRDFCISDGRTWEVVPDRCDQVNILGIKIISNSGGDDGIDLVRTSNVNIDGCFIHTKDDCIAIKSHTPDAQLRGTHHVNIQNCIFWNTDWGNGFEIGFELRAPRIHDITMKNCDFIHVEKGAVISIHNADFAVVEDVLFENIRVEDARQKLLDFAILWTWYSLDAPRQNEYQARYQQGGVWDNVMEFYPGEKELHARNRGYIRKVTVRNLHIVDGGLPFSIMQGFDREHLVSEVLIENLTLYGRPLKTLPEARIHSELATGIEFK